MFPALTEFVQWQGSGGVANLRNSSIFKINGRQLLTLHFIGIASLLAKRARFRAAEPLLVLSLSKGPLEPVLARF